MNKRLNNIFFVFGLLAVVIMALTLDFSLEEMFAQLRRAGWWLLLLLSMWIVLYLLNTVSFRIIIRGSGNCSISFIELMKITVTGFSLNYATPAGLMGGEPYKILELKNYIGLERASSSVLLFAMMHVFSHFWYWLTAVVLYLLFLPVSVVMAYILALITVFCVAGIMVFIRGYKGGFVSGLVFRLARVPLLRRWLSRWCVRHRHQLEKIDGQIAALHGQERRSFYSSLLMEYFGRVLQSFEIFFILVLCAGCEPSVFLFIKSLIILAFTSLLANILFFLPLQLGGREAGFTIFIASVGMTVQTSLVVALLCRVRELFWTLLGLLLIKVRLPEHLRRAV